MPHLACSYHANFDLRGANLEGAFLYRSDLSGSDLRGVNLTGAMFGDVNIKNADLRDVKGLTREQLAGTLNADTAQLPDYLDLSLLSKEES